MYISDIALSIWYYRNTGDLDIQNLITPIMYGIINYGLLTYKVRKADIENEKNKKNENREETTSINDS